MKNENFKNSYDLERAKLILHIKYILSICIGIVAVVIVASTYNKNEFVNQISFAGMISSIILSVIAIIITLIGEMKSDNTKDKLSNVSDELENVARGIVEATIKLESATNTNKDLYNGINIVQKGIEDIGQAIFHKDIETYDEVSADSYDAESTEGKEDIHDCYLQVFKDAALSMNEQVYKDVAITLFYIALKQVTGSNQVSYTEYIEDLNKLQIQLSNPTVGWDICLLFSRPLWTDNNFNSAVYESIRIRYSDEVGKIITFFQTKTELNKI